MLPLVAALAITAGIGAVIWIRGGNHGQYKERGWALFILTIGALFISAMQLGLPVPNPVDLIMSLFKPIYQPIIGWIEKG